MDRGGAVPTCKAAKAPPHAPPNSGCLVDPGSACCRVGAAAVRAARARKWGPTDLASSLASHVAIGQHGPRPRLPWARSWARCLIEAARAGAWPWHGHHDGMGHAMGHEP